MRGKDLDKRVIIEKVEKIRKRAAHYRLQTGHSIKNIRHFVLKVRDNGKMGETKKRKYDAPPHGQFCNRTILRFATSGFV